MARDWLFAPASFDGIPFYVNSSERRGGRMIVVHQYPGSELHDTEDLGRRAGELEITAYFASETADADLAALQSRLVLPGAGTLITPMLGVMRARAAHWTPDWSPQALNYVALRITFIEDGAAGAPFPIGLGVAMLAQSGMALGAALGGAISTAVAGAPLTSYLRSDIATQVARTGSGVDSVRAATALPVDIDTQVKLTVADAVTSLSGGPSVDPGAVAATIFGALDTVIYEKTGGDLVTPLTNGMNASLAAYNASLTQWGLSQQVSIAPLAAAVAYAGQLCRVLASETYPDRQSGIAARAKIGSIAAQITALYAPLGTDATDAFDAIYGQSAQFLSNQIVNLAPIMLVTTASSLPSNVIAYQLYGDPSRGQELADRNMIGTPCFMPLQFEAKSS